MIMESNITSPPSTPQKSIKFLIPNAPPDAPKKKHRINRNIKREIDKIIQMDIDRSTKIIFLENLGLNRDVITTEIIPFQEEEHSVKLKLNF
tara:strand:+ start:312 stop:587 length:276 start_codon:yes stop_codon:yes gene_type:complete